MSTRYEDDMIEISDGDNYLMLCQGRKTLFLGGPLEEKIPLANLGAFESGADSLQIRTSQDARVIELPLPSTGAQGIEQAVMRLNQALVDWR